MYYVCIEENQIVSIVDYKPSVPKSVSIFEIGKEEYENITERQTHFFDVETKTIKQNSLTVEKEKKKRIQNIESMRFLETTDWKVLRHIREKSLGIVTSLTEGEYIKLENLRHEAANSISKL